MTDSPLRFRRARVGDLPEIVAMLADDELGAKREDPRFRSTPATLRLLPPSSRTRTSTSRWSSATRA